MDSLSDNVRDVAKKYVQRAKRDGKSELSIAVRDLLKDLDKTKFPANRVPLVCHAIKTRGFQRENGLEITGIDGPASKTSPTVVVHYKIKDALTGGDAGASSPPVTPSSEEGPGDRAARHIEKLRSVIKLDLAKYGGAEGFMRWVRGQDEDAE